MDPKIKAVIYSDNACPNCKALIPYSSVYQYFYAHDCRTEFEFTCDNCEHVFNVEVEAIPAFKFSKASQYGVHLTAADASDDGLSSQSGDR